jgi:hypothetical protein
MEEETVRKLIGCLMFVALLLPVIASAQGQPAPSDEWKFKWGGAERVRHEYWRNWKDMNNQNTPATEDNRNLFRVKTSLWGQADYGKNLSGYLRLANEFRAYPYFGGTTGSNPDKSADKKGYYFDINEVVVDNLYADIKNFMELPVDLRIGRQDFLGAYGEGFLIMDGTPGDGSRTFYFNAAKASWRMDDKNTIDFVYINNPRDEEFMPVINRTMLERRGTNKDKAPFNLNTTDEIGYVAYWKNKSVENLSLEGYYIYKSEDDQGGVGAQSKKSQINTIGSFAKYNFSPFTFRGQLASQFGKYGDEDRTGLGGYGWLDYDFKDTAWSPQASIGYVYLSGNDLDSAKNEGWDPLFSRFPLWSELYLLSYAGETGVVGYWTNLSMPGATLKFKPSEKMKLSFSYYYLMANEDVASSSIFSGTSKQRGTMPQVRIDYTFDKKKNVTGYIIAEYLDPGKFYKNEDPAIFVRTELQVKF